MPTAFVPPKSKLIAALQRQVRALEGVGEISRDRIMATGCPRLDEILPAKGLRRGSLVEWIGEASGAGTMAMLVARQFCAEGGLLVVIDRHGQFYPPAAASLGIDLAELLIVRPAKPREELWAFEQALRCPAVAAVWGCLEQVASRSFRRLQLAAEEGGSVGFLLRSRECLREPTWADVSLGVQSCAGAKIPRFRVEVLRSHGNGVGSSNEIEFAETTATFR